LPSVLRMSSALAWVQNCATHRASLRRMQLIDWGRFCAARPRATEPPRLTRHDAGGPFSFYPEPMSDPEEALPMGGRASCRV
ncbi:MAG: hypothetical protein PVH68_15750, partial [Armatimonadota bacterium]